MFIICLVLFHLVSMLSIPRYANFVCAQTVSISYVLYIARSGDGRKAKAKSMPMPGAAYCMGQNGTSMDILRVQPETSTKNI